MTSEAPIVGLFVTCLVDLMRPAVGFAAVKLLQQAGCHVEVPENQTCCGQPAYNSGDRKGGRLLALNVIAAFEGFDYVVAPSGSCASMIVKHYPALFEVDSPERQRAENLATKTYELTSFLCDVMHIKTLDSKLDQTITYHDSCSGYRELGIHHQPRQLLSMIDDLKIVEMQDSNVCCGFGGTFCVKNSVISNDMVTKKVKNITEREADILLAGDLGCLLNITGKLKRQGITIEVRHVAEVLAGDMASLAIGEEG